MNTEPLSFSFGIEDFDLAKLPIDPDLLRSNRGMLETAVSDYYASYFRSLGGDARISVSKGVVGVSWVPAANLDGLVSLAVSLLQRGDYPIGVQMLEGARRRESDNPTILLNLGMALSDVGRLDEAVSALRRLLELEPGNARAWNALGVAHQRSGDHDQAEEALRRSLELDPDDGYGHRNLGSLIARKSPKDALPHLRRAAELLPDDQASAYGYGLALLESGDAGAADPILQKAIDLSPLSPIAEHARSARTRLAHANMRKATGGAPRLDAVMYCLSAMKLFAQSPEKRQAVTFEVAMLGRGGLDINDSARKYTLKSLPGNFSGLQLVSYMYVGIKQLAPTQDPGIDLSSEYSQAKQLFDAGGA